MRGACVDCGQQALELYEASIYDTGGVSHLELCRHCRDRLERRGVIYQSRMCVRCRALSDPTRAEGLQFDDGLNDSQTNILHICDTCRRALLVDGRAEVSA
jgi:hypothetical protein